MKRRVSCSSRGFRSLVKVAVIAAVALLLQLWAVERRSQINSLLFVGIHSYDLATIRKAIELGADVNAVDYSVYRNRGTWRGTLNRIFRPRKFDTFGPTPLMEVVWRVDLSEYRADNLTLRTNPHPDIVKFLLEHGANPNVAFAGEYSYASVTGAPRISVPLLARAIGTADQATIDMLIRYGAEVNTRDPSVDPWNTPFAVALSNGQVETVRMLIRHGLDIDMPNRGGTTPIQSARLFAASFAGQPTLRDMSQKSNEILAMMEEAERSRHRQ